MSNIIYTESDYRKNLILYWRQYYPGWDIPKGYHVHHIIPKSLGIQMGWSQERINHPKNLIALHPDDHVSIHKCRGDKINESFIAINNLDRKSIGEKIRNSLISNQSVNGEKNPMFGDTRKFYNNGIETRRFEEDKQPDGWVLGKILKEKPNGGRGKKYYTNGKDSRMFNKGEQPDGWVLGNHNSKGKNNASSKYGGPNKNKKAYNNGVKVVYLSDNEIIPDGYILGVTDKIKEKCRKASTGKNNPRYGSRGEKFYNNGKITKLFVPGKEPEGWVRGLIRKKTKSE